MNLTAYPDSLVNAFKPIKIWLDKLKTTKWYDKYTKVEDLAKKYVTFQRFVDEAQTYINTMHLDKTVQEVFDDMMWIKFPTKKSSSKTIIKPPRPKTIDLNKAFNNKDELLWYVKTIRNDDKFNDIWNWFSLKYLAYRDYSYILKKDWETFPYKNINDVQRWLKTNWYYNQ
jgi:hypothetical protein